MSKENAKKFYEEILSKGQKESWEKKSALEMDEIIKKEGYDFTIEELKEVIKSGITAQELSLEELDLATGGSSYGPGGCDTVYYSRPCDATVEQGSWCSSNDWCEFWDSLYICDQNQLCPGNDTRWIPA